MRYGFIVPKGDPRTVADLAREAEEAGWDGVFYFDGIWVGGGMEIYDPWVVMAAMTMRTERVRLGAILTPPARRRPWKLARETATLITSRADAWSCRWDSAPWMTAASVR